jgi:hypothetical protein
MPSRKQRRRREKSFRHEYETVLLDDEGNEIPVDPEELRQQRAEREKQRAQARPAKGSAPAKRGGRATREPPLPTWNRALKRGGTIGAVMFVAFVFVLKGGSQSSRAAIAVIYGVAFVPLTYWIDRGVYRNWQKRQARAAGQSTAKK